MVDKPPRIRIPGDIASLIRGLHPHLKKKIRASFEILLSEAHAGKALRDELSGLRSLPVSRLQIIYRISGKGRIEIVAIGPRERIYEETYRIVSREERNGQ